MPGDLVRRWLRRLREDRKGGVAVLTAIALSAILGFSGLGIDATMWYIQQRDLQGAADAAAYTAEIALKAGESKSTYTDEAEGVAAQYGFTNGTDNVTVTVNNPPKSGNYTSNSSAVEVIVSQPQTLLFSSLIHSAATTTGRAVAAPNTTSAPTCVAALADGDESVKLDVDITGSADLDLSSCGLAVDSSNSDALSLSGASTITAEKVTIVGNYSLSGSASINATDGVSTGASAPSNPYSSFSIPSYSGCNQTNYDPPDWGTASINASGSTPYVFCGGLQVGGSLSLTLGPGIYIVNGGSLSVSGAGSLSCSGCTIIVTNSTGSNYGTAGNSGSGAINITAPTSGATAGYAIVVDPNAPEATDSFSGAATENITGVIYMPSQDADFSGSATNTSQCTVLYAYSIDVSGAASFGGSCSGTGVAGMSSSEAALVE